MVSHLSEIQTERHIASTGIDGLMSLEDKALLDALVAILAGGTTGQVLAKAGDDDYDFYWVTVEE